MEKNKETLQAEIRGNLDADGHLSCAKAHQIADTLNIEPGVVGKTSNDLEIRITRCQLGFFGYAPQKGMPGYKVVKKLDKLPEPVASLVKESAKAGKIPCLKLWQIAEQQKVELLDIGNVAETLGIKVTPCQLGCF